jgi:hypothetical protein
MKKIIFYSLIFLALSGTTTGFADSGNLKVNNGIINENSTSKNSQSSIAYQVAPNLFLGSMAKANQELNKNNDMAVSVSQSSNFAKKVNIKEDTLPVVSNLFKKGSMVSIVSSTNNPSNNTMLDTSEFFIFFAVIGALAATVLGIFLGQKYAQWFRKKT